MRVSSLSSCDLHAEHEQRATSSKARSVHALRLENLTWRLSAVQSKKFCRALPSSLRGLAEDHQAHRYNSPDLHIPPAKSRSPSLLRHGRPRSRHGSPLRPYFHHRVSVRRGSSPKSASDSDSQTCRVRQGSPGKSPRRSMSPRRFLAAGRPRRTQRSSRCGSASPLRSTMPFAFEVQKVTEQRHARTSRSVTSADSKSVVKLSRSSHAAVASSQPSNRPSGGRSCQASSRADVGVRSKHRGSATSTDPSCRATSTSPLTTHELEDALKSLASDSSAQRKQRVRSTDAGSLACAILGSDLLPPHTAKQWRHASTGSLRASERKKVSFSNELEVEVPIITSRCRASRSAGPGLGEYCQPPRRAEDQARANLARLVANNQRVMRRSSEWSRKVEDQARENVYHCITCRWMPSVRDRVRQLAAKMRRGAERKLTSHVALCGDVLFICNRPNSLEKAVALSGAEVSVSDTVVSIGALHDNGRLQLHLGCAGEAARWASELQAASVLLETTLQRQPKQHVQGKLLDASLSQPTEQELRWTQMVACEEARGRGLLGSSSWKLHVASMMQAAFPLIWRNHGHPKPACARP